MRTQIFWTMLFAKLFLGPSFLCEPVVILSFLMCAGGIVLGASPQFDSGPDVRQHPQLTFIFAASMIPGALYNVFAPCTCGPLPR